MLVCTLSVCEHMCAEYTWVCIFMYVYMCVGIRLHISICIFLCVNFTCMCPNGCVYLMVSVLVCVHEYMFMYMYPVVCVHACDSCMYKCVRVCMCVCVYVCICVHVCLCIYILAHMNDHIYVYV